MSKITIDNYEALIRMNDDPAILQDKSLQWESFTDNWFKLARFVKGFGDNSKKLCQNMVLTYSDEIETTQYYAGQLMSYKRSVRRYHAYPVSIVSNSELKKGEVIQFNEDSEIETKQEFIMEWTINAALS